MEFPKRYALGASIIMCGFVGAFGNIKAVNEGRMFRLGASAKHRGPDDLGTWADHRFRVLFNRLSIIELSQAGHQPMSVPSGNWVVTFNGEIYNHLDIRNRLPKYNYRGTSDTETICHAFEVWGIEKTIGQLNGMFAIAAYNKADHTLKLVRDHAGIKPLFYSIGTESIWFASQFNQIIEGIGKKKVTLCQSGVRDFIQLSYMQAPNTIYKEIRQVESGEIVSFDAQKIRSHFRYYQLSKSGMDQGDSCGRSYREDFDNLMTTVVSEQLISDVPIGCFISSGIDSVLVSGFASKTNKSIKTFTIGTNGHSADEREKANQYSAALGLGHMSQAIDPEEILGAVDSSIALAGEPFGDYSSLPTFLITKSARAHNTVMLSGDGGDELFWGYPRWNTFLRNYDRFKLPRPIRRAQSFLAKKSTAKYAYGPGVLSTPGEWVLNSQSRIGIGTINSLIPESNNSRAIEELYRFSYGPTRREFRDWLRWNEFYGHLQMVLTKVDRMSMANSLEVRVPFLDKRIVEFAWTQPSLFGEKHFINKKFLKRQLSQFIPEDQINHEKIGFDIPMDEWLRGPLRNVVSDNLIAKEFYGGEFFDEGARNRYVRDFYTKGHTSPGGIWNLFCWQRWGNYMNEDSESSRLRTAP
jgi:asparagine synthase (glutamine-hydrolysing)